MPPMRGKVRSSRGPTKDALEACVESQIALSRQLIDTLTTQRNELQAQVDKLKAEVTELKTKVNTQEEELRFYKCVQKMDAKELAPKKRRTSS